MTRRKYAPEEKIRIVLEGFCREVTMSDLCRWEGIKPSAYYAWTKDFMEGENEHLTRDTARLATRREMEQLNRGSHDLKMFVGGLSLDLQRVKTTNMSPLGDSVVV